MKNKKPLSEKPNFTKAKEMEYRFRDLEGKLKRSEEREKQLEQRVRIDEFISTNKQQTLFAQLRAMEARCHLAYTIMDLQKEKDFYEENRIYAQGYLDLIRSKVLI